MEQNDPRNTVLDFLIATGKERLNMPRIKFDFTPIPEANNLLNDIEKYPHIFVLGCVMDRQIKASRAWTIPYLVGKEIGGFEFEKFLKLTLDELKDIFTAKKIHRFNDVMAECFFSAVQRIHTEYADHAEKIWSDNPSSAAVIRRFLEFKGVGVKIANMATNILIRDFKVPMRDYSSIDIAPDVQVIGYFKHHGLLRKDGEIDELIYLARELYPEFPGLLDIAAWEGGRKIKK